MLLEKNIIKKNCMKEIKNIWLAAPDSFPDFLTEISIEARTQNEQYIQTVSEDFQKQVKSFPMNAKRRVKWKQKMIGMLDQVLGEETIIGVHYAMDQHALGAFQDELKEFLVHARKFAPELSIEEIGQAIRNYVVYAMFNEMNQIRSGFSMACFGYSMLYPFTDNYIDNPQCSDLDKIRYNQIIRDKIEGKEVHPESMHQQKTCELLSAIESEYPRDSDSTIFTLLSLMLEAQEDSLRQQAKGTSLTLSERLDISLYKGGISVLIDRFFVKKEITEDDMSFYLGFGFFLQLADDLQDIGEDSRAGHQTVLTVDESCEYKEKTVNKMLHFVHRLLLDFQAENNVFKNFVLNNCYQLIYSSAVGSREFFSQEYLENLEKYLPVTYSFLEKMNRKQNDNKDFKIQDKYMKIMDEMIAPDK
ncbi:MAG: hypothetical protein WCG21_05590 [Eubacteriales bacterium]